jgi:HNH endonuclease
MHVLVAKTFVPNPDGKLNVKHKNGVITDNNAVNLEWCD